MNARPRFLYWLLCLVSPASLAAAPPGDSPYDIVITDVRAIDPETHLDAVRTIAIRGRQIAAIAEGGLRGRRTIDGRAASPSVASAV